MLITCWEEKKQTVHPYRGWRGCNDKSDVADSRDVEDAAIPTPRDTDAPTLPRDTDNPVERQYP